MQTFTDAQVMAIRRGLYAGIRAGIAPDARLRHGLRPIDEYHTYELIEMWSDPDTQESTQHA